MATGIGFGKMILFGEHFVVYGYPSIASGITEHTIATIEASNEPGFTVVDNRNASKEYKDKYRKKQRDSIQMMNKAIWGLDFEKTPIKCTLTGNLLCASGVGASAASCVSMARAVSEHFGLGYDDEMINKCGLEGDKAYAGNPSGIDNTCSTYGGFMDYKKNLGTGPHHIQPITTKKKLHMVMIASKKMTPTTVVIEGVREWGLANPERFASIMAESIAIHGMGMIALKSGDLDTIGKLMNRNHELLQTVTASRKELDDLVLLCRENGALGAKMTGGGRGGYMIALAPDESVQTRIADAARARGFELMTPIIGNDENNGE